MSVRKSAVAKTSAGLRRGLRRSPVDLRPPIILIGFHRSGTSILQHLLGLHPDVVAWFEPRTLWRCAAPSRDHDEFDESDATDSVKAYIRARFARYQAENGGRRVIEKTPANVLSIPYVTRIFPEARLLYITRHPLSCISSADFKWHRTKTWSGLRRTLYATPVTQLPYYAADFWDHMIMSRVLGRKARLVFGPRYRGMNRDLEQHDRISVIARQWAHASKKAREDIARVGGERTLAFRYEDLVENPAAMLRRIFSHCDLAHDDGIVSAAEEILDQGRQAKWQRLSQAELKSSWRELADELDASGYTMPRPFDTSHT